MAELHHGVIQSFSAYYFAGALFTLSLYIGARQFIKRCIHIGKSSIGRRYVAIITAVLGYMASTIAEWGGKMHVSPGEIDVDVDYIKEALYIVLAVL